MKKIAAFFGILAVAASCQKTQVLPEPADEAFSSLEIAFDITDGTPETRSIKKNWAKGDAVYIFFDKQIVNPPQYLVVKYNSGKWEADYWSPGLESKISKKTSGTLTALYVPNDKVYGTIDITYDSSTSYLVIPKDKNGDRFYSHHLRAKGERYTVSNGVLSASISLKCTNGYIVQFCLPNKDRNGNAIDNSTSAVSTVYKYRLKYDGTGNSYGNPYAVYMYGSDDNFSVGGNLYSVGGIMGKWMNAYFYGGLCFSCEAVGAGGTQTFDFTLNDGKNTYVYSTTGKIEAGKAYKLPAMNEKDSSGNYKWVLDTGNVNTGNLNMGYDSPFWETEEQLY